MDNFLFLKPIETTFIVVPILAFVQEVKKAKTVPLSIS